jgi:adenosylcobinamide-phosphate synthase
MQVGLIALITAIVLDLLAGDPPNRFHPVVAMGSLIHWGAARAGAGSPIGLFLYGMAIILVGGGLFSLPWLAVGWGIGSLPVWIQGILVGIALKPMFAIRRLLEAGGQVRAALERADLPEAQRLTAWHLVSRDTSRLTEAQVASAVVESLAENLTDSFFAPLLAFAVGGLPLAWFYRFVNTADAIIGYHTPRYEYLGKFAARLDDVLNWLPARLAAMTLALAAWLRGLDGGCAWRVMAAQHGQTASPNAGWTMAAAAGALRVRLEKLGHYVLDGGDSLPTAQDIRRASGLVGAAAVLCLLICGCVVYGLGILL